MTQAAKFFGATLQQIAESTDDDKLFEIVAFANRYVRQSPYVGPKMRDGSILAQGAMADIEAAAQSRRAFLTRSAAAATASS